MPDTQSIDSALSPKPGRKSTASSTTSSAINAAAGALVWGTTWLFQEDKSHVQLRRIFFSAPTEIIMGLVVIVNVLFVIQEVDAASYGQDVPFSISIMNRAFVFVYLSELLLRFYLLRLTMFKDPFTVVDVFVVIIDMCIMLFLGAVGFKNSSIIRVFRLAKLARTVHLMEKAPELHLMMKGIYGAVKSIFYGAILSCSLLLFWSILAVEFVQPTQRIIIQRGYYDEWPCDRCPRAFESVWDSFHTFVRTVVCGDSWGTFTGPVIEEQPILIVFFLVVYATVNFVVLNMILAVIIDSAQAARTVSTRELAEEKEKSFVKAQNRLMEICSHLDEDKDGMLTMEELDKGFNSDEEFSDILKSLGINHEDMPVVFSVMDDDDSGSVSFQEFVAQLYAMQKNDTQSMLMHLRYYLQKILRVMSEKMLFVEKKLATMITEDEQSITQSLAQTKASLSSLIAEEEKLVEAKVEDETRQISALIDSASATAGASLTQLSKDLSSQRDASLQAKSRCLEDSLRSPTGGTQELARKLDEVHVAMLDLLSQFAKQPLEEYLLARPIDVRLPKKSHANGRVRI